MVLLLCCVAAAVHKLVSVCEMCAPLCWMMQSPFVLLYLISLLFFSLNQQVLYTDVDVSDVQLLGYFCDKYQWNAATNMSE